MRIEKKKTLRGYAGKPDIESKQTGLRSKLAFYIHPAEGGQPEEQ